MNESKFQKSNVKKYQEQKPPIGILRKNVFQHPKKQVHETKIHATYVKSVQFVKLLNGSE